MSHFSPTMFGLQVHIPSASVHSLLTEPSAWHKHSENRKKLFVTSSILIFWKLILYPEELGSSTSLVHSCHKGVQQYYLYIYIFLYLYHKYCQSFLLYYIDSLKKYMNMNWKDFGTTMDFKKVTDILYIQSQECIPTSFF